MVSRLMHQVHELRDALAQSQEEVCVYVCVCVCKDIHSYIDVHELRDALGPGPVSGRGVCVCVCVCACVCKDIHISPRTPRCPGPVSGRRGVRLRLRLRLRVRLRVFTHIQRACKSKFYTRPI